MEFRRKESPDGEKPRQQMSKTGDALCIYHKMRTAGGSKCVH